MANAGSHHGVLLPFMQQHSQDCAPSDQVGGEHAGTLAALFMFVRLRTVAYAVANSCSNSTRHGGAQTMPPGFIAPDMLLITAPHLISPI